MAKAASTTRTGRGKSKAPELVAQADPQAPLDGALFLKAARPVLAKLATDLLERAQGSPGIQAALAARHAAEVEDRRTGDPFAVWQRRYVGQVADAWLLSCVFVRTLEDRGLLGRNRLAGPGAVDSQKLFLELAPSLTERDYLLLVYRELARFPAARSLFDPRHNPVWKLAPSAEGAKALLQLFRTPDAGSPGFRFGQADTRFLGDLYQDLDEEVRERYALLQTPRFVESFILDRTLEPAIERFGLDDTNLIDPTCGSGHFLLGAFERLCDHQQRANPGLRVVEAAGRALTAVAGTDINPYAVAIAKFRLTLAYLEKVRLRRLKDAPELKVNVAVADSLLQVSTQTEFADRPGQKADVWQGEELALENEEEAKAVLGQHYAAVVGNPPYITVADEVLRKRYREVYPEACHRLYQLVAPFAYRFFQLAKSSGFVGSIVGNGFMKREFGKPLIEKIFPRINLTTVINAAGAYIPGHGTPTALVFGSAEPPIKSEVLVVLGKRGEPGIPSSPESGVVWQSIAGHSGEAGFEDEYISVSLVPRSKLAKHPWSLGGGGAGELKDLLEGLASGRLNDVIEAIGRSTVAGEDDVWIATSTAWRRFGLEDVSRTLVIGECVRDWALNNSPSVLYPYSSLGGPPVGRDHSLVRHLWPWRALLENRTVFGKQMKATGRLWWEHLEHYSDKLKTPLSMAFAFVATHNHFVLDRGGKVFNRTAPIIKLPETATEEDHLAILAYLNSSTACFLLKQVCFDKGNRGEGGGTTAEAWERFFEFTAAGVGQIPMPRLEHAQRERIVQLASRMLRKASERASLTEPDSLFDSPMTADQLSDRFAQREQQVSQIEHELRGYQECLDWAFYAAFGLCSEDQIPLARPAVPGSRASDVILAKQVTRGAAGRRFFSLCRLPPPEVVGSSEWIQTHGIADRIEAIERSPQLRILETPECKRTFREGFRPVDWVALATDRLLALQESWWRSQGTNINRLPDTSAVLGAEAVGLLEWISGQQPEASVHRLVAANSVPFVTAFRHTDVGRSKTEQWQLTWDLQRREDAGEKVGSIPVPPKYDVNDFREPNYFRLRGRLDVPKERFISYPGCESDQDGELVYGWAGWNHLQRAQALTALYQKRKTEEAWGKERLTPMLAGLLELIPWVKQWHNEPSDEFGGLRLGDYFETFLVGECAELGLTTDDLRAWRPPTKGKRGRKREPVADDSSSPRPSPRAAGRGRKRKTGIVHEDANATVDADGPFIALPEGES